ncbi:hypothetical protein [Acinetobacter sp. ANC 5414]|uniref:hypothetical protein n=1 Tax=Acinetobacter sp. ANC 5414 TaxID=2731251 RepID=UPI0014905FEA|nr:hypothetical protein [Acinetobacter sp. ANC 5414]NNH01968.1 hypothetical protein [Acinetobacter sp. ANC 5414]
MFYKVFLSISVVAALSVCSSVAIAAEQLQSIQSTSESENEVAPCSNGFDDVNVCQLRS